MYLEIATEEDKKEVESWKADAKGILIFVRLYLSSRFEPYADSMVIDWSIFRCCCIVYLSVHSGPQAEPTGHL
jgi:hypothetical protein